MDSRTGYVGYTHKGEKHQVLRGRTKSYGSLQAEMKMIEDARSKVPKRTSVSTVEEGL